MKRLNARLMLLTLWRGGLTAGGRCVPRQHGGLGMQLDGGVPLRAWRAARASLALLLLASAAATAGVAVGTPRIVGLQRGEEGRLAFDLALSGDPGEVLDIFASERLDAPDWRVLGPYLRPEGARQWRWTEPADGVPGPDARTRFFRVGRADIDLNENGIADAREALIHVHDLPPEARARWARAGLGGMPTNFPTLLNVRLSGAKGNGVADDTAAIAAVIAQAPANSVVYLPAGVYRLTQSLQLKPDMILRGDGPTLTSLMFEGAGTADRCIGIIRWDSQQPTTYTTLTDGLLMGSTVVTVASVAGIQAGDIVEIEEDNDPAWGLTDGWQARLPGQINRVAAVDTGQRRLTLERHLRHTYTAARNPRLRRLVTIANVGIENLFVRRNDAVVGYTVEMKYAVRCWIRNVESYMTYKAHVWMDRAYECEVRRSYFHDSFVFGGGGQGYGVGCGKRTSDCLIEDNIFRHLRHSMIVGIGANGNVYGYNFSTQRALDPVHGTPQADISVHGNYVFMNLFEGNVLEDADVPDWYWPAGPGNTLFRNRIGNSGTAIDVGSNNQNFLGNVLLNGTIKLQSVLSGIVDYGNVKQGDMENIGWPGCGCRNLPDSLYRSVPPDFVRQAAGVSWPPLGPDRPLEAVTPAQQRYLAGPG